MFLNDNSAAAVGKQTFAEENDQRIRQPLDFFLITEIFSVFVCLILATQRILAATNHCKMSNTPKTQTERYSHELCNCTQKNSSTRYRTHPPTHEEETLEKMLRLKCQCIERQQASQATTCSRRVSIILH